MKKTVIKYITTAAKQIEISYVLGCSTYLKITNVKIYTDLYNNKKGIEISPVIIAVITRCID